MAVLPPSCLTYLCIFRYLNQYVHRSKNHVAYLFLLLFLRVLVPETAVLALHSHEHTQEELNEEFGFKLDKRHQHCHMDELFSAPYMPNQSVFLKALTLTFNDSYSANHSYIWKFTFPTNTDLRGPPAV